MPSTSFPCCNLRAQRSARLLGFSLFGAMLFSDHAHTVRPVIKLALCMCECVYVHIFQSQVKWPLKQLLVFNLTNTDYHMGGFWYTGIFT